MQVAPEEVADAAGGMEEDKRTAIAEMSADTEAQLAVEAELAERYSVPVEIFQADAGVDTDCVRVSSIRGFNGEQRFAVATSTVAVNVSLLPYPSLRDVRSIAQEMKKPKCSQLVLRNQKLLTCKVAAAEAMEVERK
ncbi:hypothetical protein E2562_021108 [Oryza meyeriana var. granulata]|uniref:Uncharacterized protein n=1 Tax=Oryza meyeriana var. granulata TaxID=110450 RepID=A0A6G1BMH1_9ORYZ|nr:hypothetical protein E2562_021108 [Oryza meyeriana var. granulata]